MTVSICIPTYNRSALVEKAIRSALSQTKPALEILVGDDSVDSRTEAMIKRVEPDCRVPIRYFRNAPPLGQAANVERLFRMAQGERLLLLHDDDVLRPNAIALLEAAFSASPRIVAAYGKQLIMDEEGRVDEAASQRLNRAYCRTPQRAGIQPSPLKMAVLQQFPNDGFLVDARTAKTIGYQQRDIKDGCDFAFSLRMARTGGDFCFIDQFTSKARITRESVSHSKINTSAYESLRLVLEASDIDLADEEVAMWIRTMIPVAIVSAAQCRDTRTALRWYFGAWHRGRILTVGGLGRLLAILWPAFHAKVHRMRALSRRAA